MLSKANQYYTSQKLSQAIVAYEFIIVVLEENRYRGKYVDQKYIVYIRLAKIYLESKEFEKSLNTYQLHVKGVEKESTDEINTINKLPLSVLKELEDLGVTYMLYGEYPTAEEIYKYVLEIREMYYGALIEEMLRVKHNLGVLYRKKGELTEAESLSVQVLSKRMEILGPEDRETLETKYELANTLCDERQYKKAREMYEEILETQTRLFGENDLETIRTSNNLALTSYELGNFAEAETIYNDVLMKREERFGEWHSDTLTTKNDLALMYIESKELEKAEGICEEVIEKRKEIFGEKHPDTLTTRHNLALLHHYRSNFEKAEEQNRLLIKDRREKLGDRHPDTLSTGKNLGSVYRYKDELNKAEEILSEVLELRREVLGENHLSTLTTKNTLASINRQRGNYKEAERIHKEVLEEKIKQTSKDSPGVFKIMRNLALLYFEVGKYEEATPLFLEALEVSRKLWGKHNKDSAEILRALGRIYEDENNYEEAERCYKMALASDEDKVRSILSTHNLLISLFRTQKRNSEVKEFILKKRRVLENQQFSDIEEIIRINEDLSSIYIKEKDYESIARICKNRVTRSSFSVENFLDIAHFEAKITPILCFYGDNRSGKSVLMKILHASQMWAHRKLSANDPDEKGYCKDSFINKLSLSVNYTKMSRERDKVRKARAIEISQEFFNSLTQQLKEMIRFQIWSISAYFSIGRGETPKETWQRLVEEGKYGIFTGKNNMFESVVTYDSNLGVDATLKTKFTLELIESIEDNRKVQLKVALDSGENFIFQLAEEQYQLQTFPTVSYLHDVYLISDFQFTTPKITSENLTKWMLSILFDCTPFVFFRGSSTIFPAHRSGLALAMPHLKNFGQSTERYLSREDTDFLTYLRNHLSLGTRGLGNSESKIGKEIDIMFRKIQRERAQIMEHVHGFESLEFSKIINSVEGRQEIRYKSGEVASSSLLLAPLDLYIQRLKSFPNKESIRDAILNRNLDNVLIYEEPEQGLHPNLLHLFYKLIVKMYDVFATNKLDLGIICTSHHPYFLEGILNEQMSLYKLANISNHYQAVMFTLDEQGKTLGKALEIDKEGYDPNPFTDANVHLYNESAKWRFEYEEGDIN